jgi:hypothetical protein
MSNTSDGVGGYSHFLPMHFPEPMHADRMIFSYMPWGAPGLMGMRGRSVDESAEPRLVISFEWPMHWLRTATPLTQIEVEVLHLQRFSRDQALVSGTVPFLWLEPGEDPPDLIGHHPEGTVGIECTSLGLAQRRSAHDLFSRIRRSLLEIPSVRLSRLAGNVIYLWFDDAEGRPFARNDQEAIDDLVQQLIDYEPAGEDLWLPSGEMPEQAPPLPLITTQQGARFYCVPLTNAAPDTYLFSLTGIELGLALTTVHDASSEWAALIERVRRKDREGVDWLVITAGGPDQDGRLFTAEEVLADFLLQHPQALTDLEHLKRVTLHFWGTGRAVDLWPEHVDLFGPMYRGITPQHQPLVVAVGEMEPTGQLNSDPE